jgi:hypothetical protein
MDRFFIRAAERRLPLQAAPADRPEWAPAVAAELAELTARYGFEFAEFPDEEGEATGAPDTAPELAPRS